MVVVALLHALVQWTMDSLVINDKVEAYRSKMNYEELTEETQDKKQ